MDDVVARIARLRAMRARMARADQLRLEDERRRLQEEEAGWSARLHEAANGPREDGGDAVAAGMYVLHGELARRQAAAKVDKQDALVQRQAEQVMELERQQKIAERLAERRAARREEERRRKEQAELDELARIGWWRGDDK